MRQSEYQEYTDIQHLLKSDEWRSFVKFQRHRAVKLKDKVVSLVREKKYEDALKTVAVIDDIEKQMVLFVHREAELEKEAQKQ